MKEPLLVDEGPLIRYIADRILPIIGPSSAYGDVRKGMMKAFATYSNDKTDMGQIDSAKTLKCLMESCGEDLTEAEAEEMFATMLELPPAKPSQPSGTFAYEQWAKTVVDMARKQSEEEQSDLQRLLNVAAPLLLLVALVVLIPLFS